MGTVPLSVSYRREWRLWWPDYDANAEGVYAYCMKRIRDADLGLPFVKKRRVCVQAGGHVGLWPNRLSKKFQTVYSFEPDPDCREALIRNARVNVIVRPEGLSSQPGRQLLSIRKSTGSSQILPGADEGKPITHKVEIECITIDSLKLPCLDLIVLDIEGHEIPALSGAAESIKQFKPVIHVEALKPNREATYGYLRSIGYVQRKSAHNDSVWTSASAS